MPVEKHEILAAIKPLVEAGASCHWLRPMTKRPWAERWADTATLGFEALEFLYKDGSNIGIRLGEPSKTGAGFIHAIDMDIRDPDLRDEAVAKLAEFLPDWEGYPRVRSGSGGESFHLYFTTEAPFRGRKLARSTGFQMVWDSKKEREVKKFDWEIEFFGTGKQIVLPPSIHPDTGEPYRWEKRLDLSCADMGIGPAIDFQVIEGWGLNQDEHEFDEDDLMVSLRNEPMGLKPERVIAVLSELPPDLPDDRDGWLTVGSALHHEFRGDETGFAYWCDWSRQSEKFDEDDQRRVWKSFGERKRPVRMASLIHMAATYQMQVNHGEFDEEDDDDTFGDDPTADLLGEDGKADPAADLFGDDDDLSFLERAESRTATERANAQSTHDTEWKSQFSRTEDGSVKTVLNNIRLILENDPRTKGLLGYNDFTKEIVRVKAPGEFKRRRKGFKEIPQLDARLFHYTGNPNGDEWRDTHEHFIRNCFESSESAGGYDLRITDRDLRAAVALIAESNTFHPVKDYLDECAENWDGTERLDMIYTQYFACADTPYHRECSALTLIAPVARIYEPGCKYDHMIVIEGAQGMGKSTAVSTLANGWFGELNLEDIKDDRKAVEQSQGCLMMEAGELVGLNKADHRLVKSFQTRQVDKTRLAYERFARKFPRQFVVIGTTNETDYLSDPTGNRRFLPIVGPRDHRVNLLELKKNLPQLYGEAVHRYRAMRRATNGEYLPLTLQSNEAKAEALRLQEMRRREGDEESLAGSIESFLDKPVNFEFEDLEGQVHEYHHVTCGIQVWCEFLGEERSRYVRGTPAKINHALNSLPGWERLSDRVNIAGFGRQRVYVRKADHPLFEDMTESQIERVLAQAKSTGKPVALDPNAVPKVIKFKQRRP